MLGLRMFALPILLGMALVTAGCSASSTVTDPGTGEPVDLGESEVREYRGEKLGSAADFRENSIKGPQRVDRETYSLAIDGLVETPLKLTYDEVLDRTPYEKVVTLHCVEGWSVKILWKGVRLADLLAQAGYDPGGQIVIFSCADGYTTSLPLDYVIDENILLAHRMNGLDLPPERGFPFQVVAEDKWGYKWAKWVTGIEVGDDLTYRGYWESRGYEDDATLPPGR